jgi:hypothetical protein
MALGPHKIGHRQAGGKEGRPMLRSYHYEEKRGIDPPVRAYGRFLQLPPAVVASVSWLVGLTLVDACVQLFYFYLSLLVGA